jgi:hypothetical protein
MRQGVFLLLTRQGSNLDSSEPKSDVLPVTPRVRGGFENRIANILNIKINLQFFPGLPQS